tara:strand:+ start:178 stop:390 length:213 start_codon:yes stop_codon:yes gene_type:complete
MAGKTTAKPKINKEKPMVDMTHIDDIILRLSAVESSIDIIRIDVDTAIDKLGMHELTTRVEKVEARLGLG